MFLPITIPMPMLSSNKSMRVKNITSPSMMKSMVASLRTLVKGRMVISMIMLKKSFVNLLFNLANLALLTILLLL